MSGTGAIPKRSGGSRAPAASKKDGSNELVGEPLDKKYLILPNSTVQQEVPALHKCWMEKGTYLRYIPPPPLVMPSGDPPPPGAVDSWMEQMTLLEEDLKTLLHLPHHKFWSQMVYDTMVHVCLASYLSACPRWYQDIQMDGRCEEMSRSLHYLVFRIYVRLATPRESATCHITPSVFAQIIYDNFLFDACKLLDLSVLYGPSSPALMSRMFGCVFRHQPKYYKDLSSAVTSIIATALEGVESKLGVLDCNIPLPLDATPEKLSEADLRTVILFLLETFSSLYLFLSLHPPASKCFQDHVNEVRIASFYEQVIPAINDRLSELENKGAELNPRIQKEFSVMRSCALATFRAIVNYWCFDPLHEDKVDTYMAEKCMEKFMNTISSCVGERIFITDYCSAYAIDTDLQMFKEKVGDVTCLDFIKEAVTTVFKEMESLPKGEPSLPSDSLLSLIKPRTTTTTTTNTTTNTITTRTKPDQGSEDTSGMNGYAETGSGEVPEMELVAAVSSVQELLPDLGAGFIRECLRHYNHSPEKVINALLEESLPPSLSSLDRSAPLPPSPPPPQPSSFASSSQKNNPSSIPTSGILEQRSNVYDNDEFDLFSRPDVDKSRIHKGKKAATTKKILYEKDEVVVEKLKEIGRQYEERGGTSIYEDETRYEDGEEHYAWEYDDEYDDTYDDNETGNIDEIGTEKAVKRRPGIIGAGRLNTDIIIPGQDDDDDDDDVEEEEEGKRANTQLTGRKQQQQQEYNEDWQRGGRVNTNAKPKVPKTNTRGVQRVFNKSTNSSSKKPHTPTPERELMGGEGGGGGGREAGREAGGGGGEEVEWREREEQQQQANSYSYPPSHSPSPSHSYSSPSHSNHSHSQSYQKQQQHHQRLYSHPHSQHRQYSQQQSNSYSQPYSQSYSKQHHHQQQWTHTQTHHRPAFQPFCENPEVVRQRAEQRRQTRDFNRGYRGRGGGYGGGGGEQSWKEPRATTNGVEEGERGGGGGGGGDYGGGWGGGPGRPKMASNKHSGKGWRHGEGDEDRGGYRGGKYKEDSNHGRAQSQQYRHKMTHKNEHKRQGAQAKFNRNN